MAVTMWTVSILLLTMPLSSLSEKQFFWHITDMHYDPTYLTTQESCNKNISQENLGMYGDFECDPPWELLESSVEAMSIIGHHPQFILWTGDNPLHAKTASKFDLSARLQMIQNVTDLIKSKFPDKLVIPCLGNHDYYPVDQLPEGPDPVYQATAQMWNDWIPADQVTNYEKGGFYTISVDSKLRIISVNTNLYNSNNEVTQNMEDPAGQFEWMTSELGKARSKGEKVYLVTHIPSGSFESTLEVRWFAEKFNTKLNQLIREYADVIIGIYSSHQHLDSFRLFYDQGQPVASMLIAPSVSPWRARIGPNIYGEAHNPAIRQIEYDDSDYHLIDVQQYYLNLTKANAEKNAKWLLEYNFMRAYGVGITTADLHKLAQGFHNHGDETFHRYYDFYTVTTKHSSIVPCSCECKHAHLCAIEKIDFDEHTKCLADMTTCGAAKRMMTILTMTSSMIITLFSHHIW